MGRKCCVPGCTGNYDKKWEGCDRVSVFRFPADPDRRELWRSKIPKKDFTPNDNSVVCARHFTEDCIIRLDAFQSTENGTVKKVKRKIPKLTDDAYPTIFINLKPARRKAPNRVTPRKTQKGRSKDAQDRAGRLFQQGMENDKIASFTDFCNELENRKKDKTWMAKPHENGSQSYYSFYQFNDLPNSIPSLSSVIRIFSDMKVEVFTNLNTPACLDPVPNTALDWLFGNSSPPILRAWVQFDTLLSYFSTTSHQVLNDVHIKEELTVYSDTGSAADDDDDEGSDEQDTVTDKELFAEGLTSQASYNRDSSERQEVDKASDVMCNAGGGDDEDDKEQSCSSGGLHVTGEISHDDTKQGLINDRIHDIGHADEEHGEEDERRLVSNSNRIHGIIDADQDGKKQMEQTATYDSAMYQNETNPLSENGVKESDVYNNKDSCVEDRQTKLRPPLKEHSSQDAVSYVDQTSSVSQVSKTRASKPNKAHLQKLKIKLRGAPEKQESDDHFTCWFCPKLFTHSNIREMHMKTYHKAKYFESTVVSDGENSRQQKQKHCVTCDLCQKSFKTKSGLERHKKSNKCSARAKPIICDVCGLSCKDKSRLNAHMKVHTRPYKCSECQQSFGDMNTLQRHIRVHKGEKPFECSECIASFTDKSGLVRHQRIHTGEKPYTCEVCNKSFRKKWNMKHHKKIHTRVETSKTAGVKRVPSTYKKKSSSEKNFVCELCGEAFRNKDSLVIHQFKHTGEKPYSCDICGKAFYSKYYVKLHKIIHTGESSHQCSYCNRAFHSKYQLDQHTRRHTGERPYKCEDCGRAFYRITDFNRHKETHSDLKPYTCEICDKSFKTKRVYWQHKRTHSEERRFQCEICSKVFKEKNSLRKHAKIHLRAQEQMWTSSLPVYA